MNDPSRQFLGGDMQDLDEARADPRRQPLDPGTGLTSPHYTAWRTWRGPGAGRNREVAWRGPHRRVALGFGHGGPTIQQGRPGRSACHRRGRGTPRITRGPGSGGGTAAGSRRGRPALRGRTGRPPGTRPLRPAGRDARSGNGCAAPRVPPPSPPSAMPGARWEPQISRARPSPPRTSYDSADGRSGGSVIVTTTFPFLRPSSTCRCASAIRCNE